MTTSASEKPEKRLNYGENWSNGLGVFLGKILNGKKM